MSFNTTTTIVHDPYAHTYDVVRRTVAREVDDITGRQRTRLVAETFLCERQTRQAAEHDLRTIMDDLAEHGSGCLRRPGEPRLAR